MRIVRFVYQKEEYWGKLEDGIIQIFIEAPFRKLKLSSKNVRLNQVRLLAPAIPSKIILVGLNYRDHARELNMPIPKEPVIFLKPPTSLIGNKDRIIYPKMAKRLDYEAELALVIKKEARNIPERKVSEYILGYTCLNDVTARDLQKNDGQWTRSKSFDTFCPLGPWINTGINPASLRVCSYLNGALKQDSSTRNFIFSVNNIVSYISRIMTLLPGDVISTGTPSGIGQMKPMDKIAIEIEGLGRLENQVVRGKK